MIAKGESDMNCLKCRAENPEINRFCRECGAKLTVCCPRCDAEILLSDKFCGQCGHDLAKHKEGPLAGHKPPQSFTPKFLADKILTARGSMEGERKLVTVLFADVVGYTSMSDGRDPEEVYQIMEGCYEIFMNEIHRYEGTIDKFTGDGVMALFGAPVAHEDHAQRACYAALSIMNAVREYGVKLRHDYDLEFRIRIGLNSGFVIIASIGDDLRMDYTALGDTVNLASRMETLAEPGTILASKGTYRQVTGYFEFQPLGRQQIKGKRLPMEVYKLLRPGKIQTRLEAAAATKGLTRFVGRKREIGILKEELSKARAGQGQVIGIVGEPGVGKSRLLLEFKTMLPPEEYTCIEGRCLHFGDTIAYLPFRNILKSYVNMVAGEEDTLFEERLEEKLTRVDAGRKDHLPPLIDLLGLEINDVQFMELEPKQRKQKTFDAIQALLETISREKPLVLVIEDVHWIDKTSEELLDYLMGWIPNTKSLILLLYRPEYIHPWERQPFYTRLVLNPLCPAESGRMAQSLMTQGDMAPDLQKFISARTGGNPFFVEELTRHLFETGFIQKQGSQNVISGQRPEIQVPDTIQAIIAARIDRLEENLKHTLQVASVVGREFALPILQDVIEGASQLPSYLMELQDQELVHQKRGLPGAEYIFKHALTQSVAYNTLLVAKRKQLHEKTAKAIEARYAEKVEGFYEILAHHYSRSDNRAKALFYLKQAAEKSLRMHSLWEAFHFYRHAVEILNQMPKTTENTEEQVQLRLGMASAMIPLGYPEDSIEILKEGERQAKELGDAKSLAVLYSRIGHYFTIRGGQPGLGVKYSEKSFEEAVKIEDLDTLAPVACDLFISYHTVGAYPKTARMAPEVIARLERAGKTAAFFGRAYNVYAALLTFHGQGLGLMGNFSSGERLCKLGLDHAFQTKHPYTLALVELFFGHMLTCKGDVRGIITHMKRGIKYCEKAQGILILGLLWGFLGYGHLLAGRLDLAKEHVRKGMKIQRDAGVPVFLSMQHWFLSQIYFDSGEVAAARDHIREALDLAEKNHENWMKGNAAVSHGRILAKEDPKQWQRAEAEILRGIKSLEDLGTKPYRDQGLFFLGEFYTETGQPEKAGQILQEVHGRFQEMDMTSWASRTGRILQGLRPGIRSY